MATKKIIKNNKAVLITTEHRGVFFGFIKDDKKLPAEITLIGVRNCISWSSDIGGFLGLASVGPNQNCKIGKEVVESKFYKITSVTPVQEAAVEKWKKA